MEKEGALAGRVMAGVLGGGSEVGGRKVGGGLGGWAGCGRWVGGWDSKLGGGGALGPVYSRPPTCVPKRITCSPATLLIQRTSRHPSHFGSAPAIMCHASHSSQSQASTRPPDSSCGAVSSASTLQHGHRATSSLKSGVCWAACSLQFTSSILRSSSSNDIGTRQRSG